MGRGGRGVKPSVLFTKTPPVTTPPDPCCSALTRGPIVTYILSGRRFSTFSWRFPAAGSSSTIDAQGFGTICSTNRDPVQNSLCTIPLCTCFPGPPDDPPSPARRVFGAAPGLQTRSWGEQITQRFVAAVPGCPIEPFHVSRDKFYKGLGRVVDEGSTTYCFQRNVRLRGLYRSGVGPPCEACRERPLPNLKNCRNFVWEL